MSLKTWRLTLLVAFSILVLILGKVLLYADEGMWLLNNLPLKYLQEKYGFTPTPDWVDKVQKSSARLPNCSSSFVSGDGLLMTNWHCAEEAVQGLSTAQNNLYEKGFYAPTYAQELKTGLNVKVLMKVYNVRRGAQTDPDLKCEEVPLYLGAFTETYCYKVYDDVRLVLALERNVGFFGGDADNFEYPRYTLDVAFLRAYENGKPAKTPNHFKWSKSGPNPNELIFVSGHPGSTKRLMTSDALRTERDLRVPFLLDLFRRREMTLQQYMLQGKEQKRIAVSDLFGWQNSRKLYVGKIRGLQDLHMMESKLAFERKVKSEASPADLADWDTGERMIREAQQSINVHFKKTMLVGRGLGFDSQIFSVDDRSGLNLEYEEYKLRDSLTHLVEVLGAEDLFVLGMLRNFGSSPSEIAHGLVNDELFTDKFVQYVRAEGTSLVQAMTNASDREKQGYAMISKVLFKLYGTDVYPDATFTLRLAYGEMSGYSVNGKDFSPFTTIGEAYRHSLEFDRAGDYKLPYRWWLRRKFVNQRTPLNFVSDLDITGGNSGSPVFNKNLEIVGLVFDGNAESLTSDYDFNFNQGNRAISVHSAGILEMLSKVYRAHALVRELTRP